MLLLVILLLLLMGNWAISEILVFLPLNLFAHVVSLGRLAVLFVLLLFLAWCLGDE